MCGIVLVARFDAPLDDAVRGSARLISAAMQKRGPDGSGEWISDDGCVLLAHRRLAVIDLTEAGSQPMRWPERGLAITFNGEIYNYLQLRKELENRGHRFTSRSDTEVILHAYAEWGDAAVQRLRGMYALAIFDEPSRSVFLARDPFGIKPLYYAWDGATLRAASQVKALLAGGGVDNSADAAGWAGFLLFGSVPEPWTNYQGIKALPAGSCVTAGPAGMQAPRRFAEISEAFTGEYEPIQKGGTDLYADTRSALIDSVQAHLVSDVSVGLFLSAGTDSGALAALMHEIGCRDICTVTLGFEEFRGTHEDEVPLAEQMAHRIGARHSTKIISRKEFLDDWPRIIDAMDQPSVDGANTWLVSKAAREAGLKVAISGIGGDELFGGYPSFEQIPRWNRLMRRVGAIPLAASGGYLFARGAARLSGRIPPKLPAVFRYAHTMEGAYFCRRGLFMPWELPAIVGPEFARKGLEALCPLGHIAKQVSPTLTNPLAMVMAMESVLYLRNQLLRDSDWASMDHSVELRTPLVDWRLWRTLAPILSGRPAGGKAPLSIAPAPALRIETPGRAKTGFGLPLANWLRDWRSDTNVQYVPDIKGGVSRWLAASLATSALS